MLEEKTTTAQADGGVSPEELRAQAGTYAFLARALSDEELPGDFVRSLAAGAPQTGTALDAFAAGLAGLDEAGLEAVRRELAADHSACLLGMSAKPVSPYESVYTTPEQLMRRKARDEAVAAYAAAGFAPATQLRVPEDHIAIELQFCSALLARAADFLAAREPEAAQRDLDAHAAYLRDHLAVWVPRFCDLLEDRAHTDFYRGAAQMLRLLVQGEGATE